MDTIHNVVNTLFEKKAVWEVHIKNMNDLFVYQCLCIIGGGTGLPHYDQRSCILSGAPEVCFPTVHIIRVNFLGDAPWLRHCREFTWLVCWVPVFGIDTEQFHQVWDSGPLRPPPLPVQPLAAPRPAAAGEAGCHLKGEREGENYTD